jgi:predicted RecB family endonuclease
MTVEYVKVDRVVLEELLKEVSELKKLAKEQLFLTKTEKRGRGLEELR